jgi:hypothetical protein
MPCGEGIDGEGLLLVPNLPDRLFDTSAGARSKKTASPNRFPHRP